MRVCQFRHDGKWTSIVAACTGRRIRKTCPSILQALGWLSNQFPQGIPETRWEQLQSSMNDCARIALITEKQKC
jgi:hypothetical protein